MKLFYKTSFQFYQNSRLGNARKQAHKHMSDKIVGFCLWCYMRNPIPQCHAFIVLVQDLNDETPLSL